MKVSIITPCYNSELFIEETILSVKRQDCSDYEHIIVDGGSTDKTLEIIKKYYGTYNMKFISERDNGMYDAISKGFALATGDIICWLNSDDTFFSWAVRVMKYVMENNAHVFWCTGLPTSQSNLGFPTIKSSLFPAYSRKKIARGWHHGRGMGFIQQESTFWRKEVLANINLETFKNYKAAGDYFLWKSLAKTYELYTVNTPIGCFRVHDGQISGEIEKYFLELKEDYGFLKFVYWLINKAFNINKIYYFKNRKNRIFVSPKEDSFKEKIKNTIRINKSVNKKT